MQENDVLNVSPHAGSWLGGASSAHQTIQSKTSQSGAQFVAVALRKLRGRFHPPARPCRLAARARGFSTETLGRNRARVQSVQNMGGV